MTNAAFFLRLRFQRIVVRKVEGRWPLDFLIAVVGNEMNIFYLFFELCNEMNIVFFFLVQMNIVFFSL